MRSPRTLALAAAAVLAVAACAGGGTPAPPASSAAAGGGGSATAVTVKDFSFQPASVSVAVGSTVTWTNRDSTRHTVTAGDGSFDSGPLPSGATFSQTFTRAGTFAYHCAIHPSMTATITVH